MENNCRILADNHFISNDTWQTGLNNNDLIIGPSGAGKTRGYVIPNILQCNGSMVVADTKGTICPEVGPILAQEGYREWQIRAFLGTGYPYACRLHCPGRDGARPILGEHGADIP